MTLPPLGNSDLIVASVSIDFPSNSQQDAPFHCIVYDYFCADWDSLCDHLRDAPWEDIFRLRLLLLLVYFVSGFRLELMHVPHLKYQVKPHSSTWFSADCAADIVHRNHYFRLCQQNKSSKSKVMFRQASNRCNCCQLQQLPLLHMLLKQNSLSLPRNLALGTFGELLIVFLTKINQLYLLYI